MSFHHSNVIPVIWMSFHHSNVIPSFQFHSTIPMSFQSFKCHSSHLNVIPSFERHSINLSSWWQYTVIRCQSIHSMVIRALEWREMTFLWNDRNDVGMTVSVIPSTFPSSPSSPSSQIAGKNGAILDFIPVIPDYSRHSGVIRKFSTNVNFLEWRRNDGRFWAEVDQFPWIKSRHNVHKWKNSSKCSCVISFSEFCDLSAVW